MISNTKIIVITELYLCFCLQAAELAEIARQESELAAARLEELTHSASAGEIISEVESKYV